jgi:hypothetical protein
MRRKLACYCLLAPIVTSVLGTLVGLVERQHDPWAILAPFVGFAYGLVGAGIGLVVLGTSKLMYLPSLRGLILAVVVCSVTLAAILQLAYLDLLRAGFMVWAMGWIVWLAWPIIQGVPTASQTSSRTPPPASGPT